VAPLTGSVRLGSTVPAIPGRRGGWWHEYVCPAHGTELLAARDQVFPCPHGCELTGEPYEGAWTVLAHQAAARSLRRLAVRALGGDRAAGDAAVAGLAHYAELYERLAGAEHPDAQGWMLSGRLFQQALTEAIWATSLAHAVQTLAGSVDPSRLAAATELLGALRDAARAARDVLVGRDDFRNNYTAWLNAAGASTSRALALLGEPDQSGHWLAGRHGVAEHAAAAVHPDGWEWEGSSYYHVFVLRGYLLALRGCARIPDSLLGRLHAMIDVVAVFGSDAGGTLPAVHDTPYAGARWDDEVYELCLLSAQLPGAPSLSRLAEPLATRLRPDREDHWRSAEARGWFAATAGPPPASSPAAPSGSPGGLPGPIGAGSLGPIAAGSDRAGPTGAGPTGARLFPDAGYAVLRGTGYQAVFDFGPHGGSHGHLDKLALYLYGPTAPWQPAYGVPPYAHPMRRDYYAATAAHPTLTVDGAEQREATGRLLYWHDGTPAVAVGADVPAALGAEAAAVSGAEAVAVGAEAEAVGGAEAVAVGAEADVYPGVRFERHLRADAELLVDVVRVEADRERELELHLRADVDVRVRRSGAGTRTDWPGDSGLVGLHTATPGAVLSTGADLGPADDPQRSRPHLRWRVGGRRAVFASVYSPTGAAEGIHLEQDGGELTVHVERRDGPPVHWRVPDQEAEVAG